MKGNVGGLKKALINLSNINHFFYTENSVCFLEI